MCSLSLGSQLIFDLLSRIFSTGSNPGTTLNLYSSSNPNARGNTNASGPKYDSSKNEAGRGIGIVLASLEGLQVPFVFKLRFPCNNNMVEYEACIAGLKAILLLDVKNIEIYGDSLPIISQANQELKIKNKRLKAYHDHL
uniref:RNase H type-1 domain-containing protein n=1 Tax=Nelumbo nucifera TaxID=4432 RepID=A0A822XK94_NELNU|nr:TPA_asm: hypothetical protein HUJ06_023447 [Nelumbo nucifera]